MKKIYIVLFSLCTYSFGDIGYDVLKCATNVDSKIRLECYDKISSKIIKDQSIKIKKTKTKGESVEVWNKSLEYIPKDIYNGIYSEEVRLHIDYKNNTDKKIVGLITNVIIKNAFGDELLRNDFREEITVKPKKTKINDQYWLWKNNPYVNGELFDKMWLAAKNKSYKIEAKIKKIIFADGSILE